MIYGNAESDARIIILVAVLIGLAALLLGLRGLLDMRNQGDRKE